MHAPAKSPNRTYIPGIDQLRAGFALLVLFYHGFALLSARLIQHADFVVADWSHTRNPLLAVVVEGHTAVAGFMVLSGFIFVQGTYDRELRYREFLRNRILRIYPLYLVLVTIGFCSWPYAFKLTALVSLVLPLANFVSPPAGALAAMAWTVAVEFQFYLIFPLLLRLYQHHGAGLLWRLILLAAVLRLFAVALGADAQWMSYWTIAGRIDQFLLGMVAGLGYARGQAAGTARSGVRSVLVSALVVWALLYGFHLAGGWPRKVWWKALWPDAEGAAWTGFVLAWLPVAPRLPRVLARPLEAIGRISFSIYLLHFAVIDMLGMHGWILRPFADAHADALVTTLVVALPITLAGAAFTYTTIEAPFLALRRRYTSDPASARIARVTAEI